jgi:2-hydroxychromene-2-carboxylate isomerase
MIKRKLRSLYLTWLLDDRCIRLRQAWHEMRHTLTFKKRVVSVFLQLDDPYSYLLSAYLVPVINRYLKKVEFRFYLCQALGGEFMPQPGMQAEYAAQDAKLLAEELGVPFLDVGDTPAVEFRRQLLDVLAGEQEEDDFAETFTNVLSLYWRGDAEGVAKLLGRPGGGSDETNILIGKNQLLLRKLGHYNCATMYYGGEWFWGVDRLLYLVRQLDQQKLNRFRDLPDEIASLLEATRFKLPAAPPAAAQSLPPLEFYHSFRSPYSYIALKSAYAIAKAFGLQLDVKPLLPMVQRGLAMPRAKMLYIVKDANREARRRKVPFGRIADPVGEGAERCIAAFYYAKTQNRHFEFLREAGNAIFAERIDVATDEGLQQVAERVGLFWPELAEALDDDEWRHEVKRNREVLSEAGLWGVPSFRIGDQAFWGQDRDWLVARKIEDMCAGGEGIVV